jgi:hypothetical protein
MEFLAVEYAGVRLEGIVVRMDAGVTGEGAADGASVVGEVYEKVK